MRAHVLGALLLAFALPVTAQVPVSRPDTARNMNRLAAQPVVTRGQPGSFQVVSVPLPPRFLSDSTVSFLVEPVGNTSILGRRAGGLNSSANPSVLVTIGIPRAALAGVQLAARVVFVSGEDSVEVPVMIDVPAVRAVALTTPELISARAPGGRAEIVLTVTNSGNAPDTLRLAVQQPDGWPPLRATPLPIALAAGASSREVLRLDIPRMASTGDHFARVILTGSDSARAERLVRIEVGQQQSSLAPPGPTLTASVGSVAAAGGPAGLAQFNLNGPLTRTYSIDARFAFAPELESGQIRGLARVGAFVSRPQLALWSDRWRLDAGAAMASLDDLIGLNAGGDGITLGYTGETHAFNGILARPNQIEDGGHLAGGQFSMAARGLLWSGGFSSFEAGQIGQLTAASFGTQWSSERYGRIGGDLGYRSARATSGLGAALNYERSDAKGTVSARLVHAPGGSSAFARATDEVYLGGSRVINPRLDVAVTAFASRDEHAQFSSISSNAWSITPSYRINQSTSARLEARGSSYSAKGESAFGNGETRFTAGLNSGKGKLFYSGEAGVNWLSRNLDVGGGRFTSKAPQYDMRGSASYSTSFGRLQGEAAYTWTAGDVAVLPDQRSLYLRAEQLRLPQLPGNVYVDAEVGHQQWTGERALNTIRIGTSVILPQNMQLRASAERNPLYNRFDGGTPWLFALKLEKRVGLPRLRLGSAAGHVYQDLNGNGMRDEGEAGVPHVIVKQGGAKAVSDGDGAFVFWERTRGAITVEPASIPFGWLVGTSNGNPRNIALVPTSSIVVLLQLGTAERVRGVDLTTAVVIAKDAQGRAWTARRTAAETAVFDALPAGKYTVEVDFSSLAEPLRTEKPTYEFNSENRGSITINVPVMGRPLRFKKDGA